MARQVLRLPRGTDAQIKNYTGPSGELPVNTTTGTVHLQDGATPGGIPMVAVPHLDVARAEIASRIIPLRSFVCGGLAAVGDAGAGARYVRGTSAGPMAIQDALGTWFQLDMAVPIMPAGWWGVVANDPTKAAQNGVGINLAMAALAARTGGILQLPGGDIFVDRTIDNKYSDILVRGQGRGASHDAGTPTYGTRIIPVGTAFTVLRHRTPTAAERGVTWQNNWKNTGGGFTNLMVDGGSLSPRLLQVTSIANAAYHVYCTNAVAPGTEAVLFDCIPDYRFVDVSQRQLGEASDNQRLSIIIGVRQDGGLSANVDGINFGGVAYAGNTSLCYDMEVAVRFTNGVGIRLSNADNLNFKCVLLQGVGTSNMGLLVQAGPPGIAVGSIDVQSLSSNVGCHVEALSERPGAIAVGDLRIHHLDGNNATPEPTGPNVTIESTDVPLFQTTNKTFRGFAAGDTVVTAREARNFLNANPAFTAVFRNGANSGVAYLNKDGVAFFQRVNDTLNTFEFYGPGGYTFAAPMSASAGASVKGLAVGETPATAAEARAWLDAHPGFSMAVRNGSNSGVAFLTKTGDSYFQRVDDTTGNFDFFGPSTGTGVINFVPAVTMAGSLKVTGPATFSGTIKAGSFTAATLPAGTPGTLVYVSDGRKGGEAAGAGTGVMACYSNNAWRRLSDESIVIA